MNKLRKIYAENEKRRANKVFTKYFSSSLGNSNLYLNNISYVVQVFVLNILKTKTKAYIGCAIFGFCLFLFLFLKGLSVTWFEACDQLKSVAAA